MERIKQHPLVVIFLSALLLRGVYLVSILPMLDYKHYLTDEYFFDKFAWLIAQGRGSEEVLNVSLSPVYLAFLSFCYQVFGHHLLLPRLIQILAGSGVCCLLFLITEKFFSRREAWAVGLLSVFYGIFIFYDAELLKSVWVHLFLLGALLILLNGFKNPVWFFAAGFLMALACLLRMNLLFVVILSFILLWRKGERWEALLIRAALYIFGMCFAVMIFSAWFQKVMPNRQALSSESGIHFYVGNNPYANGTYIRLPQLGYNATAHTVNTIKIAEKAEGRKLSGGEVNRFWLSQGVQYILKNPGRWWGSQLKKIRLAFNHYETPNNENYYFMKAKSGFLALPWPGFGVMAPLALIGMALAWKKKAPGARMLILMSASYLLSLLVMFVTSGYRLPMQVMMMPFFGGAIICFWDLLKSRKRKEILIFMVAWLALTAVVYLPSSVNEANYLKEKISYDQVIQKRVRS